MKQQNQQPRSPSSRKAEDTMEIDKLQELDRQTSKLIGEMISQEQQRDRGILDQLAEQDRKAMTWLDELARKDMEILHNLCGDSDIVDKPRLTETIRHISSKK